MRLRRLGWILGGIGLACSTLSAQAGPGAVDLSVVSSPVSFVPAISPIPNCPNCEAAADPNCKHHEISIPNSCPPTGTNAKSDCDGDGTADDYSLDINGTAAGNDEEQPNGSVSLCCVDGSFYALTFDPAGPAGPRLVGKCPFEGGLNEGWKYINVRTGHLKDTKWSSCDGNKDDDKDGKKDEWVYKYNAGADTVGECHFEDNVEQTDGKKPHAPKERPYDFKDLCPKNPNNDDPLVAVISVGDPVIATAKAGRPPGGLAPAPGPMAGKMAEIARGRVVSFALETTVANDGPEEFALADVTIDIAAPSGCTIDGSDVARRRHTIGVNTVDLPSVFDSFDVTCDTPGIHLFTFISSVRPADDRQYDLVVEDDRSLGTIAVRALAVD